MRRACRPSIPVALPALQETLPPSLSFELLARRPDLQALRGYVTASLSQVDAAKAAFYPHFDIKAFWGYNALSVGDLFKSSFQQINLLPGLYLPIFDGGRLNANLQVGTHRQQHPDQTVQPGGAGCGSRCRHQLQPA